VGIAQALSLITAGLCVVVCFVQWRLSISDREEYCAKQQEKLMLLQTQYVELTKDHRLQISSDIERLRRYIEEIRDYREKQDQRRDQRLDNFELVIKAMRRVQP